MFSLAFSTSPHNSYERLGHRLQQLIASPHVQKRKYVEIKPAPEEREEDWLRLLSNLEDTFGICIEQLETGTVRIGWRDYSDL